MLSATSQPPRASPQAVRPEYHFGPVPPLRAPVLAGTCRHLEQEHRFDAHHPHLVPCQEPPQLAPTAHSLASASAQASDGAQPGFPEQSQRHQREQQRCLQVPLRAFQQQKLPNLTPGAFLDAQGASFGALSTVGPRNVSSLREGQSTFSILLIQHLHQSMLFLLVLIRSNQNVILTAGKGRSPEGSRSRQPVCRYQFVGATAKIESSPGSSVVGPLQVYIPKVWSKSNNRMGADFRIRPPSGPESSRSRGLQEG